MLTNLVQRLGALTPTINSICNISGVPGASVGVIYQGEVLWTENYGSSDISAGTRPTADTAYGIGSMTKAFVAAAAGRCVDEGFMGWDDAISKHLPSFQPRDRHLRDLGILRDLLRHSTGLPNPTAYYYQGDGVALLDTKEIVPTINTMHSPLDFRQEWLYSNWGYSLAGLLIQDAMGVPLRDYIHDVLLSPLQMLNSTFEPERISQKSKSYIALTDGSAFELEHRQVYRDSVLEAAGGMYSTVNDLLRWSRALLHAISTITWMPDEDTAGTSETVVRQAKEIFSAQMRMPLRHLRERTYGFGWTRLQLPGPIDSGENPVIINNDSLVLWHGGATVGYTSGIYLLPELSTAIVVLTNSMDLALASELIGQALLCTVLDTGTEVDWSARAQDRREKTVIENAQKLKDIENGRDPQCVISRPLLDFVGRYYNEAGNFFVDIRRQNSNELELAFQGLDTQGYRLRHWKCDIFEWTLSWDGAAERGRWQDVDAEFFKFHFSFDDEKGEKRINWLADPDVSMPETLKASHREQKICPDATSWLHAIWHTLVRFLSYLTMTQSASDMSPAPTVVECRS